MRLSAILLYFGAVFISNGNCLDRCNILQSIVDQWKNVNKTVDPNSCCGLSESQWELIKWYFLRVGSHLNVTEIVRDVDFFQPRCFMSYFLNDLYDHTGMEYYTSRIRYRVQDEQLDEQDTFNDTTYQWHAELSKYGYSNYFIEEDKLNIRAQILKKSWNREDDPSIGSIVLASDIEIIDHYLNGKQTKEPFHSKRAYYIILLYQRFENNAYWDRLASRILAKLWKVYGIMNAIVMGSCKKDNVSSSELIFVRNISIHFAKKRKNYLRKQQ